MVTGQVRSGSPGNNAARRERATSPRVGRGRTSVRRALLWIGGSLLALGAVVAIIGSLLPREHTATSAVTLRQPAESVWVVVRDLGGTPRWWADATASAAVADTAGREVWRQTIDGFEMDLVVVQTTPPTRMITAIDAPSDAAFGGTWTYDLTLTAGGTRVAVTEAGWIANPVFRVIARVAGYHGTLDAYLTALGRRFGEDLTPEHVARR